MSGVEASDEMPSGNECRSERVSRRVCRRDGSFVVGTLAPEWDAMRGVGLRGADGAAFLKNKCQRSVLITVDSAPKNIHEAPAGIVIREEMAPEQT